MPTLRAIWDSLPSFIVDLYDDRSKRSREIESACQVKTNDLSPEKSLEGRGLGRGVAS